MIGFSRDVSVVVCCVFMRVFVYVCISVILCACSLWCVCLRESVCVREVCLCFLCVCV